MKRKNKKGFSLAEVLISLTVVSLVMAAAAPVLTRKVNYGDDSWNWTVNETYPELQNGTIFNGDMVIIGGSKFPLVNELFSQTHFSTIPEGVINNQNTILDISDNNYKKSKVIIAKNSSRKHSLTKTYIQNFTDSHIALYNIVDNSIQYAGRLASDQFNLALGIGTLQGLQSSHTELITKNGRKTFEYKINDIEMEDINDEVERGANNTAIGHYALSMLEGGNSNVAVGYNSLLDNKSGHRNTAVGYNSLVKTNSSQDADENTVIGNFLGFFNNKYEPQQSSTNLVSDSKNLIIGNYSQNASDNREFKSNNILIGHNAGNKLSLDKTVGFNMGESNEDNYFEDIIAIDDIVQIKQGATRKVVINGDLTIRSEDGRRTLFKVDASGQTINVGNSHSRMTMYNNKAPIGPDRCEGAEVCIGKYNIPIISNDLSFITITKGHEEKYDAFIKGMAVAYDGGSYFSINNVKRVPFLGTGLTYLDRYKDSNGAVNNFLKWMNEKGNVGSTLLPDGIDDFIKAVLASLGMSDVRVKNIYADSNIGLKEINALKIKNYTYKADKTKTPHVGVIAQELQKVFPNSVFEGPDGYLRIKKEEMFYALVNSVQELSLENKQIKEKAVLAKEQIEVIKEQNDLLLQENQILEKQNKEAEKRIAKLQKSANKTK